MAECNSALRFPGQTTRFECITTHADGWKRHHFEEPGSDGLYVEWSDDCPFAFRYDPETLRRLDDTEGDA